MSLHHSRIYVALSHLVVCLCLSSIAAGIYMPQLVHHGSCDGTSCRMYILEFQCLYMKFL